MTGFERRQNILRLLREQPGMRVPQIAETLKVSEGTVRNDFDVLEEQKRLKRVRGGAVLLEAITGVPSVHLNGNMTRAEVDTARSAQLIARWAADLVQDGDTIILDASIMSLSLVSWLQERRRLTVITNSIEIARSLMGHLENTVIILGGVVESGGAVVAGDLGAAIPKELRARLAFFSANGFSVEDGLADDHLSEVSIKREMASAATEVIALLEARTIGRTALTSFAPAARVSHILTDDNLTSTQIEQVRSLDVDLTICGENTVSRHTRRRAESVWRIGFANLSEEIAFAIDVRHGLERAARERENIELVIADNRLSGERALEIADHFIAEGVDLVIEFQIDARVGLPLMNRFQRARIPVIAIDIPLIGATYFGVDNYVSGHMAGKALGEWIAEHWQGEFDWLFILAEPRAGAVPEARLQGQVAGLEEVLGPVPDAKRRILDSGNTLEPSAEAMLQALSHCAADDRIAVIAFNDDAAAGALASARALGRLDSLTVVGQGADSILRDELRSPGSRFIGSTAFMPERYGGQLIDLALRILRGESVPPAVFIDHIFVHAGNVDDIYPAGRDRI